METSQRNRSRTSKEVRAAWTADRAGEHYAGRRFANERRRGRDARRLGALVDRHAPGLIGEARVLDVACGTGRLARGLAPDGENYVGIDASRAMLGEHPLAGRTLQGDAFHLPFPDRSFELVFACRFLHHLVELADLERAAAELVRVSRRLVAVTFWDAHSLADWKNPKRGENERDPRVARPRTELEDAFARTGARVVAWSSSMRFVSRQSYALVERDRANDS